MDDHEVEAFLFHEIPLPQGDLLHVVLGGATHLLARVVLTVTDLGAIRNFSRFIRGAREGWVPPHPGDYTGTTRKKIQKAIVDNDWATFMLSIDDEH